jgi:ABC-2 type transport system ATP-binding protein
MIQVETLIKRYGDYCAVNGISFSVASGEILAFLGVNGAGKTTTIKMLTGILRPSSGRIEIGGFDLASAPEKAKALVGYIPDRPYIYQKLTAREFLYFVADLYQVPRKRADQRIDELLEAYGLVAWQDELIESFSHGMKQRTATCAALVHEPKVLIVDEPMVGLDPHGARTLKTNFRSYAKAGMAIFLSTHSLNVAEEVADRIAIIDRGNLIMVGTLAEIRAATGHSDRNLEDLFLALTSASNAE